MSTRLKRRLLIAVTITVFVLITGLFIVNNALERKNKEDEEVALKTDIEPILDRFPLLQSVNKVYWKANVTGETNFGPSTYWIKGYVYIGAEQLKVIESYEWVEASEFSPAFIVDDETEAPRWLYSDKFNNYIKSEEFVGSFYFDQNNKRLYFDVES